MASTPGRRFYDKQIAFIVAHDLDGLMAQYTDDAVLVSFDFTVSGKAALREYMQGYMQRLGAVQLLSTDKFTETGDSVFFEATMKSDLGVARVYDVFVLRDGKATHHFTGLISLEPA